jgi:hypothetical protein
MTPSNEYESEIARMVDKFAIEGRLSPFATHGIIDELGHLVLRQSEMDFLVTYIRWRLDHPIAK